MKHNLRDVTFVYIFHGDTVERLENLKLSTDYVAKHFDTRIMVYEVAAYANGIVPQILRRVVDYVFVQDDDPVLYRTKYLNRMYENVETPYVAVFDCDVIAPYRQVIEAVESLRKGEAKLAYPYHNRFLDTTTVLRKMYVESGDIRILQRNVAKMHEMNAPNPCGGAFVCEVESYRKIGFENEDYYGWGLEDGDRCVRFRCAGFGVKNVEGVLFHLSHPRGMNSNFHTDRQLSQKNRVYRNVRMKTYNQKLYDQTDDM